MTSVPLARTRRASFPCAFLSMRIPIKAKIQAIIAPLNHKHDHKLFVPLRALFIGMSYGLVPSIITVL